MMKESNYQLKITVSGDEKRRIEQLAKLRFLTVPQYIKLTALGVRVQQIKEVYIEQGALTYPVQEERLISSGDVVTSDEKEVLEQLLERGSDDGYIRFDREFNKQLLNVARRIVGKE